MITSPAVIRGAVRLGRVVPARVLRAVAWIAGRIASMALPRRRATLLENLAHLRPDLSPRQRRRLARRTFSNLTVASVDLFRIPSLTHQQLLDTVKVEGEENLKAAVALDRGVIVVTAHVGPYEYGGAWAAVRGYPVHGMVEDMPPDILEALSIYREATGMRLVSMRQGIRIVYKLLEEKQVVLLVADRAIGKAKSAVVLPFGEGRRPVPTGPATFAMLSGAPVVFGAITLNPGRSPRYLLTFEPHVLAEGRDEAERLRLTRYLTERMVEVVRSHPDEWYVFQPHWATDDGD